jgi:chromatin remodeling complex protein RSC6
VKANNLQDPVNKKLIVPNEKMKNVFQVENKIKFTEVFGLLSKHLQQK